MIKKLRELWAYRDLVANLVIRDLKVRYKNSVLGVLWSWLNPLLMMLIFTFVFGYLRGMTVSRTRTSCFSAGSCRGTSLLLPCWSSDVEAFFLPW